MRILIVASGNSYKISPFVKEQVNSLEKHGLAIDYFLIKGKGIVGYLKNYFLLRNKLTKNKCYDIIHAHYGLSGLLASMQKLVPVVITFHGSDVNLWHNYLYSWLASRLSARNIFVHSDLSKKLKIYSRDIDIIPCGIDLNIFKPMPISDARNKLGLNQNTNYVLFSSSFNNKIKNYPLARLAVKKIDNCELIEMKDLSRTEVSLLMNAVDMLLVTSFSETGPLVVKEALACNCPIISTNVGDVNKLIKNVKNCFITDYNEKEIQDKIKLILESKEKTNGRDAVKEYRLDLVSIKILKVYEKVKYVS